MNNLEIAIQAAWESATDAEREEVMEKFRDTIAREVGNACDVLTNEIENMVFTMIKEAKESGIIKT